MMPSDFRSVANAITSWFVTHMDRGDPFLAGKTFSGHSVERLNDVLATLDTFGILRRVRWPGEREYRAYVFAVDLIIERDDSDGIAENAQRSARGTDSVGGGA